MKRNDPCPCGSGKKYKACCRCQPDNPPGSEAVQLAWDWIGERYGDDVLHQAFDDYYLVSLNQAERQRLGEIGAALLTVPPRGRRNDLRRATRPRPDSS